MFALSFGCHLALISLILWYQAFLVSHQVEEPVAYVDLAAFPVAFPHSGTPAPAVVNTQEPPATPEPVSPLAALVTLPVAKPSVSPLSAARGKADKPAPIEDGREIDERLEVAKRQAEVLDKLRLGRGKAAVTPGIRGTESGSSYSAYIQARLREVFKREFTSQTESPQVLARITIGPGGQIIGYRMEKGSGDPLFDAAVMRAVTIAGWTFRPPPNGVPFKRVYRFKPEGVSLP